MRWSNMILYNCIILSMAKEISVHPQIILYFCMCAKEKTIVLSLWYINLEALLFVLNLCIKSFYLQIIPTIGMDMAQSVCWDKFLRIRIKKPSKNWNIIPMERASKDRNIQDSPHIHKNISRPPGC